jgi:quinol monooxygenase YgiN
LSQPPPSFANPSNGLDGGHKGGKGGRPQPVRSSVCRPVSGRTHARPIPAHFDQDRSNYKYHSTHVELYSSKSGLFLRFSIKPQGAMTMIRYAVEKKTVSEAVDGGGLLIIAQWEAKEGQADRVAGILERFLPEAQREPGVKLFLISRAKENPAQFLFYELFRDEAAFKAHQESAHFKTCIAGEALPLLAKRERAQYALL